MRSTRRFASTLALAAVLCAPLPAVADPGPDAPSAEQVEAGKDAVRAATAREKELQARLSAAQEQLDAANTAAGQAAERYNAARLELTRRADAAKKAEAQAAKARAAADKAETRVHQLAAQLYMQGGSLGGFENLLRAADPGSLERNAADIGAVTDYRSATLDAANKAEAKAQAASRAAAQAKLQQKAAADRADAELDAARKAAEEASARTARLQADREKMIAEVASLRRTSVALERRRQDALEEAAAKAASEAARSRAAAAASSAASGDTGKAPADLPAADSSSAGRAIAFAQGQLGDPYLWAAEGPDRWDCSGLTMKAWAAAGKSLSHWSVAQYQETSRVPISALQPGDLVFYGGSPSSIHHVGMYVGGGRMIEAPHTGAVVRYSSIYRRDLLPYGGRP